jgi:uncharacterized protein HemX
MERSSWIIIGAIGVGVAGAVYIGTQMSPSAGTLQVQTQNTSNINNANALTQTVLTDLTTQQQIMNNLNLGTPQATPVSSSTTGGSGG